MQNMIKDILLVLDSYPRPSNKRIIDSAIFLAKKLKSHVSALSFEIAFKVNTPSVLHRLGLDGPILQLIAEERGASRSNAKALLHAFEVAAQDSEVSFGKILCEESQENVTSATVEYARYRDFTIVSTKSDSEIANPTAQAVLFESGRPVLLPPQLLGDDDLISLENVAVAWDGSSAATRAVFDALPLLKLATHVRIFTIRNDKPLLSDDRFGLKAYLERHGIHPVVEDIDAAGRRTGEVLKRYVLGHEIGLLVMGGYGHSLAREFVFGGATNSVLQKPFQWTFLSH